MTGEARKCIEHEREHHLRGSITHEDVEMAEMREHVEPMLTRRELVEICESPALAFWQETEVVLSGEESKAR